MIDGMEMQILFHGEGAPIGRFAFPDGSSHPIEVPWARVELSYHCAVQALSENKLHLKRLSLHRDTVRSARS